jgi:hypothetical protein
MKAEETRLKEKLKNLQETIAKQSSGLQLVG